MTPPETTPVGCCKFCGATLTDATAGLSASVCWDCASGETPPETTPAHECHFDSDGGTCRVCGRQGGLFDAGELPAVDSLHKEPPAETPTPRTDAVEFPENISKDPVVLARFARDLERELAAANARIAELKENLKTSRAVDAALSRQFLESIPREHKLRDRITVLESALEEVSDKLHNATQHTAASHARELALREALEQIQHASGPHLHARQKETAAKALYAQPPPPVVPLALAEGLAAALEEVVGHHGCTFSGSTSDQVSSALEQWKTIQS